MAWRKTPGPPPGSAEAELAEWEAACVAAGDAERSAAVRSWRAMLRQAGGDPELGSLFVAFSIEDRHGVA